MELAVTRIPPLPAWPAVDTGPQPVSREHGYGGVGAPQVTSASLSPKTHSGGLSHHDGLLTDTRTSGVGPRVLPLT